MMIFLNCIFFILMGVVDNNIEQFKPIILFSGFGGSQLEVKLNNSIHEPYKWCQSEKDWFLLWMNVVDIIPYISTPCFLYNIELKIDYNDFMTYENQGVKVRERKFGETESVEYLSPMLEKQTVYYKKMVDYFVSKGYVRGKTIRGAAYDWRKYNLEWEKEGGIFGNVKKLIEETYVMNNNTKINLITHSMGGKFIVAFLTRFVDEIWKEKYIDKFFSLCGAYDGSFLVFPIALTGKYYTFPVRMNGVFPNYGGVYMNIPSKLFLDDVFLVTKKRNYTTSQLKDLFEDMNRPKLYDFYKHIKENEPKKPPNVTTYCFKGIGIDTPKVLYMDELNSKSYTALENIDGDGQVFIESEEICDAWKTIQTKDVYSYSFNNGYDHRGFLQDPEVMETIFKILYPS